MQAPEEAPGRQEAENKSEGISRADPFLKFLWERPSRAGWKFGASYFE